MAAEDEFSLDNIHFHFPRSRRLIEGMEPRLDLIFECRGRRRRGRRFSYLRQVAGVFDNLQFENESYEIRIEKMEQTINKLLTDRRDLQKALRAAKEADDKAQNGDEKCPEVAFGPKGA